VHSTESPPESEGRPTHRDVVPEETYLEVRTEQAFAIVPLQIKEIDALFGGAKVKVNTRKPGSQVQTFGILSSQSVSHSQPWSALSRNRRECIFSVQQGAAQEGMCAQQPSSLYPNFH
jgi:hypothetical protein